MFRFRLGRQHLNALRQSSSLFRPLTRPIADDGHSARWLSSVIQVQPDQPQSPPPSRFQSPPSGASAFPVPNTYFPTPNSPPPPPPLPPRRGRYVRSALYAIFSFTFGYTLWNTYLNTFYPRLLPLPGTVEDDILKSKLLIRGEARVRRQTSLNQCRRHDSDEDPPVLKIGLMAGARGVGYQAYFTQVGTGEHVAVLYLGGGLNGFPRTTHGGAIATVMSEVCAKAAATSSTLDPATMSPHLESFNISYRRKALSEHFFFVPCKVVDAGASADGLYIVSAHLKNEKNVLLAEATARIKMKPTQKNEDGQGEDIPTP